MNHAHQDSNTENSAPTVMDLKKLLSDVFLLPGNYKTISGFDHDMVFFKKIPVTLILNLRCQGTNDLIADEYSSVC